MKCPNCGSENVTVQVVSESNLKNKHHSIIWWIFVGWYWVPIKWIIFTVPALIIKIFAPKRQKIKTVHKSMAVCQGCGHKWEIKDK